MKGMTSGWGYSGYNTDVNYTWEWEFAPSYTVAQASFYDVTGGGLHFTGVIGYEHRPDPNGKDIAVNFGDPANWGSWRPYVYVDKCTGVTFAIAAGGDQECHVLCNLFFW